jgi:hypothetical protein
MSEIREEFNEKLLDHNKIPVPSPQPGDLVFDYYTGSPGLVLENLTTNTSKVLWSDYPQFKGEPGYFMIPGELKSVSVNMCVEVKNNE